MPSEALAKEGLLKYVYLLRSLSNSSKTYIGLTDDPERRLQEHNWRKSPHTSRHVPWEIVAVFGFKEEGRATAFERYLKSGSGIAFARKHFWDRALPPGRP